MRGSVGSIDAGEDPLRGGGGGERATGGGGSRGRRRKRSKAGTRSPFFEVEREGSLGIRRIRSTTRRCTVADRRTRGPVLRPLPPPPFQNRWRPSRDGRLRSDARRDVEVA